VIIANPIYDLTFKQLMERPSAAKVLISTILDCKIISLQAAPTEKPREPILKEPVTLYRLDYNAVIKTKDKGKQKVLIEVQKCFHESDITRFREYLGSEYFKTDLPLITIYIFGFKLLVESPAFVAPSDCYDLRTKEPVPKKDAIVKGLTHTAYFIQAPRLEPCDDTTLDQLLTLFEQKSVMKGNEFLKQLTISTINPQLKEIVDILESVASNREMTDELAVEYEQKRNYERYIGVPLLRVAERDKIIEEKDKALEENAKALEENAKAIEQKDKAIEALEEKERTLILTIQKLYQTGHSVNEISDITGLDIKEIEKILSNK